jgi:hypothetical protein
MTRTHGLRSTYCNSHCRCDLCVTANRDYMRANYTPVHRDLIGNTPGPWADRAACRGHGHLFYPTPFEQQLDRKQRHRAAQAICAACPVAADCLAFATNTGEQNGIWAGVVFDRTRHEKKAKL